MASALALYVPWTLYFLALLAICYFIGEKYMAERFGRARAYHFIVAFALVFAASMGAFGYIYGKSASTLFVGIWLLVFTAYIVT